MKSLINILLFVLLVSAGKNIYAQPYTGEAFLENPQVNGSVFSWELHFKRTNDWSSGLLQNALGHSSASFNFNTSGLVNPHVVVAPGGPLDNSNYNVTVQIISNKCVVDIGFSLDTLAGQLPLNVKTKLLTVSMDITNSGLTAGLTWDGGPSGNTGFFDFSDATVVTILTGSFDLPLPVELSSFAAKIYDKDKVKLIWKTQTEVNNYGFDIERQANNGQWEKVGFVNGSGNSNSPKEYSYVDNNLVGGSKFKYRLKQIDNDGQFKYSDAVEVKVLPTEFELSQNYPNPFNPSTTIKFSLPTETRLKINVYNMLGELVETLAEGTYEAGYHKVTFNASALPSGAYIYRIESPDFVQVRKMILIK